MDMEFKKLSEINFGEYDAANYLNSANRDLFNRLFMHDEKIEEILENNKYFILGDKGTGKTAYSVYLVNNIIQNTYASIVSMSETEYSKFVRLKEKEDLILSDYMDIWKVILLLLVSDKIYKTEDHTIFNGKSFTDIKAAIDEFYYSAFTPEIKTAMQFVEQSKISASVIFSHLNGQGEGQNQSSFSETRIQSNLIYIEKQFKDALSSFKVSKSYIVFVDGIDIRPENIAYEEYLECIKGLAQAVWTLNTSFFQENKHLKKIKIMLLLRPDIFDKMGLHNMNNKLNDNCVLLEWRTSYQNYRNSGLYKIADKLFLAQQNKELRDTLNVGDAWEHYFPYKVWNHKDRSETDSSFIPFLRYSFYRPRDILAFLNILHKYTSNRQGQFTYSDFNNSQVQKDYSNYLIGEIRDNLSFYHPSSDFELFRNFFEILKPYVDNKSRKFSYDGFKKAYKDFCDHRKQQGIDTVPFIFQSVDYLLQLIFELNIISYIEDPNSKKEYQRWYFKERSHANIRPRVKVNTEYKMHKGIAQALYVLR